MKINLIITVNLIFSYTFLSTLQCDFGANCLVTYGRKSYSIHSVIRRINSVTPHVVHLTEHYSEEQSRAKLQLTGKTDKFSIYYDSRTKDFLKYDNQESLCSSSSLESLYQSIFSDNFSTLFGLLVGKEIFEYKNSHVIGPAARLLVLLCDRSDYFIENYWPRGGRKIRNIPVAEFTLRVETSLQSEVQIFVFYNSREFNIESVCETIPLRVTILGVYINFFKYEEDNINHKSISSDAQLDEFIFPLSQNCSQFLSKKGSISLFGGYDLTKTRISFSTTSKWLFGQKKEHYVAYDGSTQLMRIDVRDLISRHDWTTTTTITDFIARREYNVFNEENFCLMTPTTFKSVRRNSAAFSLDSFLFGTDSKLSYMGLAKVRETNAFVYEVTGSYLPIWFSKPITGNETNQKTLRYTFDRRKQVSSEETFSIVIYVKSAEKQESNSVQLVYLEVTDLIKSRFLLNFHGPVLQTVFYNFKLDIDEATDGTKALDVFSVKNLCTSLEARNAEIELLIDSAELDYATPDWLKNWLTRNNAIIAGFSNYLDLPTSFIYDLESKILPFSLNVDSKSKKIVVSVTFRVVEHSKQQVYALEFISYIKIASTIDGVTSVTASSPTDCLKFLKEVSDANQELPIYVYYFDWKYQCLTNRYREFNDKTGGSVDLTQINDTEMFIRSEEKAVGELYRIRAQEESNRYQASSFFSEDKVRNLHGRVLELQHFQLEPLSRNQSNKVEKISMQIRKARLTSINYKGKKDNENETRNVARFARIGLIQSDITTKSTGVESSRQCEAACLEDFNCRVYSYCVRSGEIECLKSNLSIGNIDISLLLPNNQSRRASKNNHKFSIAVSYGKKLELVRDFRCELTGKTFLGMFRPSFTGIHSMRLQQIIPVSSAEECAEICVNNSLQTNKLRNLNLDKKLVGVKKSLGSEFCRQFKYLSILDEKGDRLFEQLGLKERFKGKAVCFLNSNQTILSASNELADLIDQTNFESDVYIFDFTSLYEKKQRFRLLSSSKGTDCDIKENVQNLKHVQSSFEVNQQFSIQADQLECAEMCFTHTFKFESFCRSFDYTITRVSNIFYSLCTLNSVSLGNFKFNQKYIDVPPSNCSPPIVTWHYEPIINSFDGKLKSVVEDSKSVVVWIFPVMFGVATGISLTIWIMNNRQFSSLR